MSLFCYFLSVELVFFRLFANNWCTASCCCDTWFLCVSVEGFFHFLCGVLF